MLNKQLEEVWGSGQRSTKFGSCQHMDGTERQGEMSSPGDGVLMHKRKGDSQG